MNWYITAFCGARSKARSAPLLIDKNDAAAARLEGEVDAAQIGERRRDACVFFGRCVEEQESPAPGTEQFAAERTGFHRAVIPSVDLAGADARGERALE